MWNKNLLGWVGNCRGKRGRGGERKGVWQQVNSKLARVHGLEEENR